MVVWLAVGNLAEHWIFYLKIMGAIYNQRLVLVNPRL